MFQISMRLILAALFALAAAGILFYAKADPVPHDAAARVQADAFWDALNRPDAVQRPSDIVVYPPQRAVQLVTCVGHPHNAKAVWKYLYVPTPDGSPTVESRLKAIGIAYRTPWQEQAWVRMGPWTAFALAAALVFWGWAAPLAKILSEASGKKSISLLSTPPVPQPSPDDLQKLRDLDEQMERSLAETAATISADSSAPIAPAHAQQTPATTVLNAGPLKILKHPPAKDKNYRGQFYPVARTNEDGFSLVELLVVIGILGVLIALLLPTLTATRRDANAIACAANLRSIAQGLGIYEVEHNGCIPASYSYTGQTNVAGVEIYNAMGYTHWSYFLYHTGSTPLSAFTCPELEQGGLPPTNTTPDNLAPGQVIDLPGITDQQAPRMAYTLNESLSPRNKFAMGFQGATRNYQFIRASSVPHSSNTILATEWARNAARFATTSGSSSFYLYSHRPVHGFVGLDGTLEMYQLNQSVAYRRITAADLDADPGTANSSATRLDWVGRNHGRMTGYPDQRRTNFLYLDGHVECKSIYDTLQPFEWGETFYTLSPNTDLQRP